MSLSDLLLELVHLPTHDVMTFRLWECFIFQVMLLLIGVDALSLMFAAVFLKWHSDINMLQVDEDEDVERTDDF